MNTLFQLLVAVLFPALAMTAAAADYSLMAESIQAVYSEDSGVPITHANRVLQTRDGYIWIASYDGLVRFDGKRAKAFGKDDGFPTSNVTTLLEDSTGRLWIGTNDAGVVLYEDNRGFRVFGKEQGLPSASVRSLVERGDGSICVATVFGLIAIGDGYALSPVYGFGRDPIVAKKMFATKGGSLICVLNEGGVLILNADGTRREYLPRHFAGLLLNSVYQAADGVIYLGTVENKAVLIRGDVAETVDTGAKSGINSFFEDSSGRVWLCSDTGMGYFKDGAFHPVDGALVESSLENMVEDYEGGFWFSSSRKGLLHVTRSKFKNVNVASGLPELTVNTTHNYDGKLYIGADEGLRILDAGGKEVQNDLTRKLDGVRIRSLASDADGNLWICTYARYGLIRYREDEAFIAFTRASHGLVGDKTRCVIPLEGGGVAVGTSEGVSIVRNDRVVKNYGKADGLANPVALSLCEGKGGVIYAGSDGGGIYRLAGDAVTNFAEKDGLPSGVILRMARDGRRKGIWISTGNSVCFWDEKGVRPITRLEGRDSSVFDIKFIGDDAIWLLGARGVCVCDADKLLAGLPGIVEVFHKRDGLTYAVTANSWNHLDVDGKLYLSCNRGVAIIDTANVHRNRTEPKLAITRVTVDDRTFPPSAVVIPPDAQRLTVDYALLSFAYATGNSMSVFLEGFDREPRAISTDDATQISYTNLKAGTYTLHLIGNNKEGVRSRETLLAITKQPKFLETQAAQFGLPLAAVALLAGMFSLFHRHKTAALVKRQHEYRAITTQAIKAIADSIDAKDRYTSGHSRRVAAYSLEIARRMGLSERVTEDLYYTALLHDIGKIGVEDGILKKEGKLTREEYEKIKDHARVGGDILKSITVIDNIAIGAKYHHERIDGKGYPSGLSNEEIPLFARIIGVADSYDAMASDRVYRKALPKGVIVDELRKGAGTQFDKRIVGIMLEIMQTIDDPAEHAARMDEAAAISLRLKAIQS